MKVTMNNQPVEVVEHKAGWYTIINAGKTMKVRRAALDITDESATTAVVTTPTPETTMSVQTTAPEPTKRAPKAPKAAAPKAPVKAKKAPVKPAKKAAATNTPAKSAKKLPTPKKAPAPAKAAAPASDVIVRGTEDGKQYEYHRAGKTQSGNVAYDCGDKTAIALRGKSLDEVYTIVAKAMLKGGDLKGDFANCTTADGVERKLRAGLKDANVGRQRMTLGNRLRALLRNA